MHILPRSPWNLHRKKRVKKDESGKAEQSLTPPVDLNRALNMSVCTKDLEDVRNVNKKIALLCFSKPQISREIL